MPDYSNDGISGNDVFKEFFSPELIKRYNLINRRQALKSVHFPENEQQLEQAIYRLKFEESFLFQFGLRLIKKRSESEAKGISFKPDGTVIAELLERLPFELTGNQRQVWREISRDMESLRPMNRLLQGDVGSGKTILAVLALAKAVESRCQGALMAPTEILAEQHYLLLQRYFAHSAVKTVLLVGKMGEKEKRAVRQQIEEGEALIIIGTHALLEDKVNFERLGLVIIDEQHRFGVRQRANLQFKGERPDVLIMTATPIPRTLALTFYNDLNISLLTEMPAGRLPIKTYWLSMSYLERVYNFIRRIVEQKQQVYIVCPLIEESEHIQAQAAQELYEELKNKVFPGISVGLLHGRMKPEEKQQVMLDFRDNRLAVLVTTTVIEVGIDVPNAVLMVIFGAERFGLSQLHQLRGRIGRGGAQSWCVLLGNPETRQGKARLDTMRRVSDGFQIAEADLQLRGPGEFFGTRQSGMLCFKILDLIKDLSLIEETKKEADALLEQPEQNRQQIKAVSAACRQYMSQNQVYVRIR